METTKLVTAVLRLTLTAAVVFAQANTIERASQCDLEAGLCGWKLGVSEDGSYNVGRGEASWVPGPSIDAVPGTEHGIYVYLNYTSPPTVNSHTLLSFPTYQYICGLSLSYFASSSLDINILRVNIGESTLPTQTTTDQWQYQELEYNVSSIEEKNKNYQLIISIEGVELGEAEMEEEPFVAAVDNITLRFCLPCNFDLLPQPGNLLLSGPPALNVSLGDVTSFSLSASSPLCPSLPLLFAIEAVEPPALVDIFSVDSENGLVVVDATGPHLLAAGTLGYINVSVHVVGSNYTRTSPPYKVITTIALEQDPVIRLHDTPREVTVEVGVPFSLQLHAAHILPSTQPLTYHLHMTPSSLQTLVTISNLGEITGVVTIETVSDILTVGGANMTVGVANEFGSSLNVSIPLLLSPSPPLSLESNLSYSVSENHSAAVSLKQLAVLRLIDPNGDYVAVPSPIEWFDGIFELYTLSSPDDGWMWEGALFVDQTKLDYENRSSFSLPLEVVDSVNSSLATSLVFHITVKSQNEHSPKFINFENRERIQASWAEGALVTPEKARDPDEGPAGEVSYAITAGNEEQFFMIDETGDVRVASSPLLPGTYHLTITASDHGSPSLSTSAVLTVTVEAIGAVDCNSNSYNAPTIHSIGIDDSRIRTPVHSNVTLYCSYEANPAVALYKWEVIPVVSERFSLVYPSPPSPHVSLLPHQLTLVGISARDAAFYTCSVTNWCGTTTADHVLFVIDYPPPVKSLSVKVLSSGTDKDTLYPSSLNISWHHPDYTSAHSDGALVDLTATTYLVQVMGDHDNVSISEVDTSIVNVLVHGLFPGNDYDITVSAVNMAGATPSANVSISLPPTSPKLTSVDTQQEPDFSLLITWEVAYDGGSPISQFTITIVPQSPRTRRQAEGVVYHVEPSAGWLHTHPLQPGRRYLVTLTLENHIGVQDYSLSEYVGHVASVECDFEPQQQCPWQLEAGTIINTQTGGIVEASVSGESSEVILRQTAAGYSCGYGFWYRLEGEVRLQVVVEGEGWSVVLEEFRGTGYEWKQVSTSESVDVDYLTPHLYSDLEIVATSNSSGGRVRLDRLILDFCLPCDLDVLRHPGQFTLTYPTSATIYLRESSELHIAASLANCDTAVIDIGTVRVVPSVLRRYVSSVVAGHNVSITVEPIPSDLAAPHSNGIIQVAVYVVGSDYGSPAGDMSTAVVGVAEIEFTIEERLEKCSDVITCGFDDGACGWSLGDYVSLTDNGKGMGVWLPLSDSHTGDVVLSRVLSGDSYCQLSLDHLVQGAEVVVAVSGVGVVWTSGTRYSYTSGTANITFDLQAVGVLEERNVTLSLAQVWNGNGSVFLDNVTLYPCTQCTTPPSDCPHLALCPAGQACPNGSESVPCPPDHYSFLGQTTCQPCPQCFNCSDAGSDPTPLERDACHSQQGKDSLVVVVGGLVAAIVVLMLCYLCTALYFLIKSRRAAVREKHRRQANQHRLVSDGDSIGTAGSLGRASQAQDRRRWKKYGEATTLMTFVPDDDSCGRGLREESSWLETVELTHTQGAEGGVVRGLGGPGEVLRNPLYEDEDEEYEEQEREEVELSNMEDWTSPPPPSTSSHL